MAQKGSNERSSRRHHPGCVHENGDTEQSMLKSRLLGSIEGTRFSTSWRLGVPYPEMLLDDLRALQYYPLRECKMDSKCICDG